MQELQAQLDRAGRLNGMGQMAAALAHELNQPLTAIASYLEAAGRLMAMPGGDPARVRTAMEAASAQTARAGEIIRRLRGFVAGDGPALRPEALRGLIEEACALALVGAGERSARIQLALPPDLPLVLVDRVQVQQVLLNLIRNAIEAMAGADRPELTIAAAEADGMVRVEVADSGPGVAPEIAAKLFQPFVTDKPGGLGVGLAISRGIVEAHGGRLWMAERPGGGTVFGVTLRRAA